MKLGSNADFSIDMADYHDEEKKDELDMVDYGLEFEDDLDETFGM